MKKAFKRSKNVKLLIIYSILFVSAGLYNFYAPADALSSHTLHYNLFLIISGSMAAMILLNGRVSTARSFNLFFGLINLLISAVAVLNITPNNYLMLTPINIFFHLIVGNVLIGYSVRQKVHKFLKKKS